MTTNVTFKNVDLYYSNNTILRDVNFTASEGEVITIKGQSGSGKSSILKLIAGLIKPRKGEIINNCVRTGFVFQNIRLLPWCSVIDNIKIPLLDIYPLQRERHDIALNLLEQFGLKEYADFWPGQISGGMASRVSLARSLAVTPDLLLLDEPMTGMDFDTKQNALRVLENHINKFKPLCFYVTHNIEESINFSTQVIRVENKTIKV